MLLHSETRKKKQVFTYNIIIIIIYLFILFIGSTESRDEKKKNKYLQFSSFKS